MQKPKPDLPASLHDLHSKIKIITQRNGVRDFVPVKRGGFKPCSSMEQQNFCRFPQLPANHSPALSRLKLSIPGKAEGRVTIADRYKEGEMRESFTEQKTNLKTAKIKPQGVYMETEPKKKDEKSLEVLKQPLTMAVFSWTSGKAGLIEKDVIK